MLKIKYVNPLQNGKNLIIPSGYESTLKVVSISYINKRKGKANVLKIKLVNPLQNGKKSHNAIRVI